MRNPRNQYLGAMFNITAVGFISSLATVFIGLYIAIWGDNAFGGRIIATGLVTAVLMACIGLPAVLNIKDEESAPEAEAKAS